MPAMLDAESTLTDRYQTTVPETVRRALKLGKRDRIHYTIRPDGEVLITRAAETRAEDEDPVLSEFLRFLAGDMARHPERIHMIDSTLVQRIQSLTGDVDVDLDRPLSADDE